jgi:hypothetical protein
MSNNPNAPIVNVASASQPNAADPTTAGAVATTKGKGGGGGGGGAGDVTTATTVSSLADLKAKAPTLYKEMMQSIAMDICTQMQASQSRLKQMWSGGTPS